MDGPVLMKTPLVYTFFSIFDAYPSL